MRRLWLIALLGVWAGMGWAQPATITAVVRVVEHQTDGNGSMADQQSRHDFGKW